MGPAGFWAELRSRGLGRPLGSPEVEKLLRGRSVAVDAAVWFYEAQLQPDLAQAYGPAGAVLKVTFDRCARWLRSGVLPIVVLEGSGGGRGDRFFAREGRGALGAAFAAQPRVRALLAALGVPFVDADGEAEASACDFVATTDFDALLFGAPAVLRGLDLRADGRSECEVWEAAGVREAAGLDRDGLICAAFLSGCDYDRRAQGGQAAPKAASSREGAGAEQSGEPSVVPRARAEAFLTTGEA